MFLRGKLRKLTKFCQGNFFEIVSKGDIKVIDILLTLKSTLTEARETNPVGFFVIDIANCASLHLSYPVQEKNFGGCIVRVPPNPFCRHLFLNCE